MKKPLKIKPSARKTPAKRPAPVGSTTPASAKSGPAIAKPTINASAIAREHGVSRETLRVWRSEGLDLTDQAAVADRVSKMPGRDPGRTAGIGESYSEARTRRMRADADRAELNARQQAGELVSLAQVEDAMAELGHELKSRLIALPQELAVVLAGLPESKIHAILKNRINDILTQIHESSPLEKR
jgi:transposase-like protein